MDSCGLYNGPAGKCGKFAINRWPGCKSRKSRRYGVFQHQFPL